MVTKRTGLGDNLYVHGYDLSGDTGSIDNLACPRPLLDVTGINKSAFERVMGRSDAQVDWTSWFNDAALAAHAALSPLPTTDIIISYLRGTSQGDPAAMAVVKQLNYDPSRQADGALSFGVQAQGSAGVALEWGEQLTAGQDTIASSGAQASKDDGASSAAGLAAVLQVVDIDSGTPTVVIEDSANDSTWATLISFTAVANGSEPTAERKTVSGTVNRYLRLNPTGTFSDLDLVVSYRRGEAVDDEAYT